MIFKLVLRVWLQFYMLKRWFLLMLWNIISRILKVIFTVFVLIRLVLLLIQLLRLELDLAIELFIQILS